MMAILTDVKWYLIVVHFYHFFSILGVLAIVIRQEREIKGIQIGKEEVKLSLFADDVTVYIENPIDSTKKPLNLISKFGKTAGSKSIFRNQRHLYKITMNDQNQKSGENLICYSNKENKVPRNKLYQGDKTCTQKTIQH
ncbi:hypothetical protein HJG60_008007 [Phyllostomus discolor]|uniref:Reverse transcriptase domain-containing protein n=1 Tax=Phyllostomus discolor TaxID=89673 RepID=A0A834BL53_9CHIR|nr:hypothetical protein HJG60_008007 [Phyllostomus discolor]